MCACLCAIKKHEFDSAKVLHNKEKNQRLVQTDQKRNLKPKAPPQYTAENKQITAAWSNTNENVVKNKKNQELNCYGNTINTHDEALPYIGLGNKCAIFKDINSEAVSDKVSNLGAVSNNP